MEASADDIQRFYDGEVDERIEACINTYGTYDAPGVFFVDKLDREVIGIEFRYDQGSEGAAAVAGDTGCEKPAATAGGVSGSGIVYPEGLKFIDLPGSFFYSIEIDNETAVGEKDIHELFRKMAADDDAHRFYSDFSIKKEPDVISVFMSEKKLRLQYECSLDRDSALPVMKDDFESFSKDFLYKMAFYDPITEHYNWNHLLSYIEMPMDMGIKDFAFAHFDVKAFRVINEVYGHVSANRVLKNIVDAMDEADFVYSSARCHNDNFAMLIKDLPEEEMMQKLNEFFEKLSHLEDDPNYTIYFRCGIVPMQLAMASGNRVADAGKLAQSLGTHPDRTEIIMYTDQMHRDIQWGNYIKAYVDTAIENDEFVVYLQPKFDITGAGEGATDSGAAQASADGKPVPHIKGAEALIRWNYRGKDFLAPYRFIPFFEKDGSIGKIDDIVLDKVCSAFKTWKDEGKPLYPISVNLSRSRLYDRNLTGHLTSIVDKYGVDHSLIDFELTESASYDNKDQMLNVLNDLRDRGFKISMDDFGTGYSSLSLLTEMPLDTLKIDKSFVDHIGMGDEREQDLVVIRHIISLAKELHFKCLAEGAEEASQVDRLRELGCEIVQGYFFSKPIPVEEYESKYL